MSQNIFLSLLILLPLVILDGLWLGFIGKAFYQKWIGSLLAPNPNWIPVLFFYPLYTMGILAFIVIPKITAPLWHIFLFGALFGFVAYGAYDITNHATLRDWPLIVTLVDMLWGALVTGLSSTVAVFFFRMFS